MNWFEDPKVLQKTRRRLGLTQAELAKNAGVKQPLIADIESGRRRLTKEIGTPIWEALADVEIERRADPALERLRKAVPFKSLRHAGPAVGTPPEQAAKETAEFAANSAELHRLIRESLERENRILAEIAANSKEIAVLQSERISKLEKSNAELRDLLGLETTSVVARSDADELREKIKAESAKADKGNLSVAGMAAENKHLDEESKD